jgi:hypothetical protein
MRIGPISRALVAMTMLYAGCAFIPFKYVPSGRPFTPKSEQRLRDDQLMQHTLDNIVASKLLDDSLVAELEDMKYEIYHHDDGAEARYMIGDSLIRIRYRNEYADDDTLQRKFFEFNIHEISHYHWFERMDEEKKEEFKTAMWNVLDDYHSFLESGHDDPADFDMTKMAQTAIEYFVNRNTHIRIWFLYDNEADFMAEAYATFPQREARQKYDEFMEPGRFVHDPEGLRSSGHLMFEGAERIPPALMQFYRGLLNDEFFQIDNRLKGRMDIPAR